MISYNDVTLLGKMGKESAKFFNRMDNVPYCQLSICYNTKKQGQPHAEWFKCEAWGDVAKIIQRLSIKPGSELLIKGKLRNRKKPNTEETETVVVILDLKVYPPHPKFANEGEENNG